MKLQELKDLLDAASNEDGDFDINFLNASGVKQVITDIIVRSSVIKGTKVIEIELE